VQLPADAKGAVQEWWGDAAAEMVVAALQTRKATTVSDGSFEDECGTASFVLEGENSTGCMLGSNVIPGMAQTKAHVVLNSEGCLAQQPWWEQFAGSMRLQRAKLRLAAMDWAPFPKALTRQAMLGVPVPSLT